MVSSKSHSLSIVVWVMVMGFAIPNQISSQDLDYTPVVNNKSQDQIIEEQNQDSEDVVPEAENDKLWSDEQWKKAKEGIEYLKPEEKEKKKKETEEALDTAEASDFSLSEWLSEIFISPGGKLVAILLIIGILVFMVMKLLMNRNPDSKRKVPDTAALVWKDSSDIPEESDMEKYLREAIETGDYKVAVRILYLMVIRQLNENKFIVWKKDKTNRDYLNEMRTRTDYPHFREVTHIYEVVWYGDFNISAPEFNKIQSVFAVYKTTLNGDAEKS